MKVQLLNIRYIENLGGLHTEFRHEQFDQLKDRKDGVLSQQIV